MSDTADPSIRPSRVHTVLLDAGGVLLDLDLDYVARVLGARGYSVREDDLRRDEALARAEIQQRIRDGERQGEVWRDYFHIQLHRAGVSAHEQDAVIDALWEAHRRIGLWTAPAPGAVETVREIRRRGFRLGVVSNAEGRVERDLASAGFDGLFDTVVDSHVVGVEKPDPRIFRIALERLSSRAQDAVFLGDLPALDVEGARAAGVTPLLLDPLDLYANEEVTRLKSIEDLLGWLGPAGG